MVRALLLAALVLGATAWADEPQTSGLRLTMDEAVARALATSAELRADQKDVGVAQAALLRSQVLLPSNPYLSGGAQSFFEKNGQVPGQGSSNFTLGYGVSLSQELEIAGQRSRRIGVAEKGIDRAMWEAKGAEQTLVASVKTSFVRALAAANRVVLAQQAVDAVDELSPTRGTKAPADDVDRMQFNIVQIQASRNRQQLRAAQQANRDALAALRYVLDVPLDASLEIVGALESSPRAVPPATEVVALALRRRPDLEAARARAAGADKQVELTNREAIPNVTLSGSVTRYSSDTFAGGELSFYLPVFDRHEGETAEAIVERERADYLVRDLERTIEWQVEQAHGAVSTAADGLRQVQQEVLPRSEENLTIERRLFHQGRVDASDLLGIQIDTLGARGEYLDALLAYSEALIELERVAGGALQNASEGSNPEP